MKKYPYETATDEQKKIGSLWWSIHHGCLVEALYVSIEARVDFIQHHKPVGEIDCRLRNLAPVLEPEKIPIAVRVRAEALAQSQGTHASIAFRLLEAGIKTHTEELEAQHNAEYPDNTWKDRSIFG